MSTPRKIDVEQVRATAKEIVERLKADPAFADQLKEDPVTTLSSAGMPDLAIPEFVNELRAPAEVSGYQQSTNTFTCVLTCVMSCIGTVL